MTASEAAASSSPSTWLKRKSSSPVPPYSAGHLEPDEVLAARLLPDLAPGPALLAPAVEVGGDVAAAELGDRFAEQLVLGGEDRAPHRRDPRARGPCPSRRRRPRLVDNPQVPTVLLVRHGQASFGAADYDVLSETGRRQARDRRRLAGRARLPAGAPPLRHPAAPAGNRGGVPRRSAGRSSRSSRAGTSSTPTTSSPTTASRPCGCRATGGETLTNRGFQAALEPALAAWVAHAEGSPTAQTWPQFSGEGSAALADLTAGLGPGETAVVVTSGGAIAAALGTLLGAPAEVFAALNRTLVNAGVTQARGRHHRHQRPLGQRPLAPRGARPRARHLPLAPSAPRRLRSARSLRPRR